MAVVGLIHESAVKWGVDEQILRKTLYCESRLKPDAIGDGGNSYGVAQIHLPSHQNKDEWITKEQALDPKWAIDWTARQFSMKRQNMWTCYRLLTD